MKLEDAILQLLANLNNPEIISITVVTKEPYSEKGHNLFGVHEMNGVAHLMKDKVDA